jgi:uncharacterized membrane protein
MGMNTVKDIAIVCGALWVILFLPVLVFVLALCKAAAPKNKIEQAKADLDQMLALGYFDETVTSGSAVVHK